MKISHLPVLVFLTAACASSNEKTTAHPKMADMPPTPTISASPFSGSRLRSTELNMQDSKKRDIGSVRMQETTNAILVLFETRKLPPGQYQVRIEDENCNEKPARRTSSSPENLVQEFKIQGQSFSDEFKMKGFTFDENSSQSLKNKSLKVYEIGKKSKLKPAACGTLEL